MTYNGLDFSNYLYIMLSTNDILEPRKKTLSSLYSRDRLSNDLRDRTSAY